MPVPADPADPREPEGLPTDWWTVADILCYLQSLGIRIARPTWSTWVSRGHAPRPEPEGRIGNNQRWRPDDVRGVARTRFPHLFPEPAESAESS